MVVEDSDQQHEVPEQHEDGHQAEQQPYHRGGFRIVSPAGAQLKCFFYFTFFFTILVGCYSKDCRPKILKTVKDF